MTRLVPALLVATLLLAPLCGAGDAARTIDSLDWIAGDWKGDFDGVPFESHYTSPEGGEILSTSKLYSEGRVVFFEFERIHVVEGDVVYTPHPAGKAKDPFRLTDHDPAVKRARFVNPENDFPTEIVFESPAPDRLQITLRGPAGEQGRVQRVRFKRTSAEAP